MNEVTTLYVTHKMIEKMKKVVSSHRAAFDFDNGYFKRGVGFDLVAEVKSEKKGLSNCGKKRKRQEKAKKLSFSKSTKNKRIIFPF